MRLVVASAMFCLLASSVIASDMQSLISKALSRGMFLFSWHFAESVVITLEQNEDIYSAEEAQVVLQDFLNKGQNWRVSMSHRRGDRRAGDEMFVMGRLEGSPGAFRLYINFDVSSGTDVIHELHLEKYND